MSAIKEHHHDEIEAGQRGTKQHPIGWLNMPGYKPETWNPIVGCSKVSPGCDNCFAEKQAFIRSFNSNTPQYKNVVVNHPLDPRYREWNGKTHLVKSALHKPAKWKKPRMIFTVDMGDLFHESTPFEWIDAVFSVMSDNDQHIYVLLTKRPERVVKFYDWKKAQHDILWEPKVNIWFGFTIENQDEANNRLPYFNFFRAAVKFVSIEPMLSPINFSESIGHSLKWHAGGLKNCISWVICGGETGPKARPMHPDWVRSLRDQCKTAGTPFYFKQWGTLAPFSTVDGRQILPFDYMKYNPDTKEGYVRGRKDDRVNGVQHHEWPKIKPIS